MALDVPRPHSRGWFNVIPTIIATQGSDMETDEGAAAGSGSGEWETLSSSGEGGTGEGEDEEEDEEEDEGEDEDEDEGMGSGSDEGEEGSGSEGSSDEGEDGDGGGRGRGGKKKAATEAPGASKKAAAAMAVGVGSFSDPREVQGLSHYLEHMLFMGSEAFPDENEYDAFLSKHGGSSNAYTELVGARWAVGWGMDWFAVRCVYKQTVGVSSLFLCVCVVVCVC
jgi:hypothetical protein